MKPASRTPAWPPYTGAMSKTLDIAVLGFGNVAKALCRLLADGHGRGGDGSELFRIVAVASRRQGMLIRRQGIAPADLASAGALVESFEPWPHGWDGREFAAKVAADVLVELTTLDVASGQPAIGHIEAALSAGKHVVTANKGPIAWDYDRLAALARERGRRLLFESTVMDGAPVFNLYRHCLRGCRVTGIRGILNSTTNVILGEMAAGRTYGEALSSAQAMGIAEADPSLDVDAWDPAAKLCTLANVMMGAGLTPPEVEREGIQSVSADRIRAAAARGTVIKLVCRAGYDERGRVVASVSPTELPASHPYATVGGTSSILTISTDLLGDLTITEEAPQLPQTAYGVLADLLDMALPAR